MNKKRQFTNKESNQKAPKVDYTFFYRHEVKRLLDNLMTEEHDMEELQSVAKHITKMEEEFYYVVSERFREAEVQEIKILSQLLMMMEDKEELGDNLYGMLFDPHIPDQNKNYILKVMDSLGYRPEVASYGEVFNNPEKAINDARKSLLNQIWFMPEIIPQVLSEMMELTPSTRDSILDDLAEYPPFYILHFLNSMAYLDDDYLATQAVKIMANSNHSGCKRVLKELRADPDRQFMHQLLDKEITRMTLKGVEAFEGEGMDHLNSERNTPDDIYQAVVSQIDGLGNRVVLFARKRYKQRGLIVVNFMVNLSEGLRDCWGYHKMKVSEYKSLIKEFREDGNIMSTDTDYARQIFCDALYTSRMRENIRPPEFAYWRQFLTEEWLKEESYTPKIDEDVMNQILQESNPAYSKDVRELHECGEFKDWFIHHPYVYELMENVVHTHKDNSSVAVTLTTQDSVENIYSEIIEQLVAPYLENYKRALLMAADFNLKRGRTKVYKTIITTIMSMGDGDVEVLKKHPFFIGLVKRSLKIASVHLKNGLDLRINPEDFDL